MKYLKTLNELFIRPKTPKGDESYIIYINGSSSLLRGDGSLSIRRRNQKVYNVLTQFGDDILYPSIYWKDAGEIVFDEVMELIDSHNVKAIVGNSAGGYTSFYLSNYYKIPSMSINPAMVSTSEAPVIQPLPQKIKNSDLFSKQLVIIGDKDTKKDFGVDGHLTIEMLKSMNFEKQGGKILILKDTYHGLSPEQFNESFKYFYKKFVK